ncbi:DUF3231 family protein [Clostridium sp. YIM B02515]|uniref:DUF3231 family protein n=1 Tax=Clostridium rhizosphaerae TaxID=2803861 RepID=A0ABS1T8G0_9CLOT|nr:DUF3231 family protein [Clostridium rhizosphaerae]
MEIVHDYKSIPLTSAEIGYLWLTYLLNSKAKQIITYAVETSEDENIKEIMQESVNLSNKNTEVSKEIFQSVSHPVPYGFSEFDIKLKSGKLYSDKLMLQTLKLYLTVGISQYGFALGLAARKDIKAFFYESMQDSLNLLNKIDNVALNKGIFMRTPNIPIPNQVEFAENKSIMGKFIGHKRPMTALEAASMFNASLSNCITKANIMGLAQTMKDDKIRDLYEKIVRTLKEHTEDLNVKLQNENLLTPSNLNSEILNSTESPFSDRLSLYYAYTLMGDLLGTYAISKINVVRKDLMLALTHLSGEVLLLIKDASDIMTERGWYEEMPKNVDRYDIIDSNEED